MWLSALVWEAQNPDRHASWPPLTQMAKHIAAATEAARSAREKADNIRMEMLTASQEELTKLSRIHAAHVGAVWGSCSHTLTPYPHGSFLHLPVLSII